MRGARRITVIGAGFSGLVSAYFLTEAGYAVRVEERAEGPGGMLRTVALPWATVETAANGILNSAAFEAFCARIGVPLVGARGSARKRYVYRGGRASRWPLRFRESLGLAARLPGWRARAPRRAESVSTWARREWGEAALAGLISPALQGIYAGDPESLSARLVFGRFFSRKEREPRPRVRGTVAPAAGMSEFVARLESHLRGRGAEFRYGRASEIRPGETTVVATSLPAARELLRVRYPAAARGMRALGTLSLVSVSILVEGAAAIDGFGCLFARGEGVRALGVLCEDRIFGGRRRPAGTEPAGAPALERWIFGGATDPDAATLGDADLLDAIRADRARAFGRGDAVAAAHVARWPAALPEYSVGLERFLDAGALGELERDGIFVTGNFTGRLGLSGIFEDARGLPARIAARGAKED